MSVNNPYQQYRQNQVQTASQGTLILMVFDGILKNIRYAKTALEERNFESANTYLIKAQDLVSELIITLNFDAGGDIAKQLYRLYEFAHYSLIQANINKDTAILEVVNEIISGLRSTWEEVIKKGAANTSNRCTGEAGIGV